jgi:hypothetical protein
MKNYLIYFLGFGLLLAACKKEQPRMSSLEEDCSCVDEVSAGFKMGQYGSNSVVPKNFIETDTIHMYVDYEFGDPNYYSLISTQVSFIADVKNAISYQWQVGNNGIQQTTESFTLTFGDTIGTIPVTLIVHAKPNLICNPTDDGYDTITKYLTIKHFKDFPLRGKYEGYNTLNPTLKYVVEVDTFKDPNQGFSIEYGIKRIVPELDIFLNMTAPRSTYSVGFVRNTIPEFQNWNYYIYSYYGKNTFEDYPIIYDRKTKTLTAKFSLKISENFITKPYQYFEKITFTGKKIE